MPLNPSSPTWILATTEESLNVVSILIGTLGGLALFLYGMHKMSDGLKAVAGDSMKTLLARLTTNRFSAALTGAFVTAVLQSSSITTVLVVGFVSAGLMTLAQTVGVIMGANVGTTVTAQMLAFDITELAWLLVAIGFLSWSFARRDLFRNVGTMLMGFGLLFIGMDQMGKATSPLRAHQPFIDLMAQMDRVVLGMLVGAAFTALVQSSSATIGIVIMLASQGHITLEAGIALGIGAKIGTCVTALLAGLGKPAEARQVGVVHVLFNVLGAVFWMPFIPQLAAIATEISPQFPELTGIDRMAEETPRQVANAITVFAVVNLAVMIWFTGPIAKLARKLVPDQKEEPPSAAQPKYLDPVFLKTPALAIDQTRRELVRLAESVDHMLEAAPDALRKGSAEDLDRIEAMDDEVDALYAEILRYLSLVAREELNTTESRRVESGVEMANNLEAIGDLIETNLISQGRRRLELGLEVNPAPDRAIAHLYQAIRESLAELIQALDSGDAETAQRVIDRKENVKSLGRKAIEEADLRLLAGEDDAVERYRIEADVAHQVTRLHYHLRRVANALLIYLEND